MGLPRQFHPRWLLAMLAASACSHPLELPPPPPSLASARVQTPAVEKRYVAGGGEVVLTFAVEGGLAKAPTATVGEKLVPMSCDADASVTNGFRCRRAVDEEPKLEDGEHGFVIQLLAEGASADTAPTPVQPAVSVIVDRLAPKLQVRDDPKFLLVIEGQPFKLELLTSESTDAELPPTVQLSAGQLDLKPVRYSSGWIFEATVTGGALVVPAKPLDPQDGDPAPRLEIRQADKAGNEAGQPLVLPLVVRKSDAPELRLEAFNGQTRAQGQGADGTWLPVTSVRERVQLEIVADRPIYSWDGAENPDLPLQCQPAPPRPYSAANVPSQRVWRGLCLGVAPGDWSSEATNLKANVYAVEAVGGKRHPTPFEVQLDLTAPEVVDASQVRLVRHVVGRNDELSTTPAKLKAAARDRSRYRSTRLEPSISKLLVYDSPVGATALLRLDVASAGAASTPDSPIALEVPATTGLAGEPALPRLWVSAVDAFGNEGGRVRLNDDSYDAAPKVDDTKVRLVRTDALAGDELVFDAGAFNGGRGDACPVVRVDVTTEPATTTTVVPSPTREGPATSVLLTPAPLRAYVEAFDKAGRSSGVVEATVLDVKAPTVAPTRLTLVREPVGAADTVAWSAGAFDADDPHASPITEVRFYTQEREGTLAGSVPGPLLGRSGAFSTAAVGTRDAGPPRVFVEASDETRLVSNRVELAGADLEPPTINLTRFAVERNAVGVADRVTWDADAAEDASAITTLWFYESAADATPVVTWTAPAGSRALAAGAVAFDFTDRSVRRLFVQAVDKTGAASLRAELPGAVDDAAPVIRPSALKIVRHPLGQADEVLGEKGAFTDTSRIVRVELLESAQGPLLAELVPDADGAFTAVSVGSARTSPARVFVRATDKAGHTSDAVEIATGADPNAPALDGAAFALARKALGDRDVLSWRADAVTDVSPIRELKIYESVQLTAPAVISWTAPDGASSLAADTLDFPEPDRSPRRLYAEAIDKTGASSGRIEVDVADIDPPVVIASRLEIERRSASLRDRVRAIADAVDDASALVRLDLLDEATGTAVGSITPAADGTFAPFEIGTLTASPQRVRLVAYDKTGLASAPAAILAGSAPAAPSVNGDLAGLERRPQGAADAATGLAGATSGAAAPVYVDAFESADAKTPLARGPVKDDGSFAAFDVGTATTAPKRLFFEAIDRTGGSSPRVAGRLGIDETSPVSDPIVARIIRKPLGTQDLLRGATRTCVDANAVVSAQFAADATGTLLLASVTPAADGSVADTAVGTGTDAPGRAWLRCVDKAGNASAWAEVETGRDVTAPTVNYALLTYTGVASPGSDTLAAASGAVFDDLTPVRSVRVFTSPWASDPTPALASVVPTPLGGFAVTALGDTPYTTVGALYLEAEDKCGNRNDRSVNRANLYAIHTGDHVPYDFSSPGARVYAVPADLDPRTASPSIGPMLRSELDLAGNAAAASGGDGKVVTITAASETRTVAPSWTRVPVFRTLGAEVVYDPVGKRFLGVTPGDTVMEVWAYANGAWSALSTSGGPATRTDFSVALDDATGTLYLFGGRSAGVALNDLWSFSGGTWTSLATGPAARYKAALVHDPDFGRLVLFRGLNSAGTVLADQWTYAYGAWTQSSITGAPADAGVCFVHNPDGRELLLFRTGTGTNNCRNATGGAIGGPFSETWSLKGTVWSRVGTDDYCDVNTKWIGGCAYVPPASGLGGSNAARVVVGRKVVDGNGTALLQNIPGGARWPAGSVTATTLGWVAANNAVPYPPEAETWTSLAYDPLNKRFLAIEQSNLRSISTIVSVTGQRGGARLLTVNGSSMDATMALDGSYVEAVDGDPLETSPLFWRPRTHELAMGIGRSRATAPGLGAFYGHAGQWRHEGNIVAPYDAHGVAPLPYADAAWSVWNISGTASEVLLPLSDPAMPAARRAVRGGCNASAVYITPDPLNDGLIHSNATAPYFCPRTGAAPTGLGGATGYDSPMAYDPARGSTFILRLGTHYQNAPPLSFITRTLPVVPPSPVGASFSYDAGLDRVVMHGGSGASGQQTWEYDGVNWIAIDTATMPPAASRPPFAYDVSRGKHLRITPGAFWEYEHIEPHRRYASAIGFFPFTAGGTLIDVAVQVSAGGSSPQGDGYTVHAWDFLSHAWVSIGTSTATPASTASERYQRIVLDKTLAQTRYLRGGAWLLVSANGSGDPAAAAPASSRLELDQLELQVVTQVQ